MNKKFMILITIILMDFLTGMEFDLFVPSFPELQNHFGLSPSLLEALISANFAGYCLSLFFLGDIADRFGNKTIILLGIITFIIGSIFCLWPFSYEFLLIGRSLQGFGIAAPAILSFLIIADLYPLKEQQFLMAILNGSMNLAVAAAPVLGSYITFYFHWRGNFAVLLIFGIVVLALTIFFIPNDKRAPHIETISLRGLEGYFAIFQSKPLILLILNLIICFTPYWIFVGMSPLLYIKDLGVSLSHFGYYQGSLALVFGVGSFLYGLIIKKYDFNQKKMLYISFQIFIVSLITIGLVTFLNKPSPLFITLALLIFVIGQIIPTTILYPLALNFFPHAKARVSAILQGTRLILTAVGLQIAGYFYEGSFHNIGIILLSLIFIGIITLFLVVNDCRLMESACE